MFRNYLLIAWRNLRKNKVFSCINIFGLALGMASCLLILQYVSFEWSYDAFHPEGKNIYRIRYDYRPQPGLLYSYATTYPGVGPRIRETFPEVEDFLRLHRVEAVVSYGDKKQLEPALFFADASFFRFFAFPLLEGVPATALAEPNTVVLSEATARCYFGAEAPLGKTIRVDGQLPLLVTGVFKDLPENTHLKADVLISFATLAALVQAQGQDIDGKWGWFAFYQYLKLKPGASPVALEKKLPHIVEKYRGKDMLSVDSFHLQPLADIHLRSKLLHEIGVNGDAETVAYLAVIAVLILVIAWINYINLSTARAAGRAKEVGIRKVVGSGRSQLIGQFMLESALLNGVSLVVAVTLVQLSAPLFSMLAGKSVPASLTGIFTGPHPGFGAALAGLLLTGVALSGAYPAFVLSAYRPVAVLKGTLLHADRGLWLRKMLISGQFVASVVLLAGTFAVYRQLGFMRNQHLGVNISQTLVVKAPQVLDPALARGKMELFKREAQTLQEVQTISSSSYVPGKEVTHARDNIFRVGDAPSSATTYHIYAIDEAFIPTYGIAMAAGRNFSSAFRTDSNAVILNEQAARSLGFAGPAAAVGRQISHPERGAVTVVGVMKNFHQRGLREKHNPTLFFLQRGTTGFFSLKIHAGNASPATMTATVEGLRSKFEQAFPGNPFDYFFLDDFYNQQYQADRQFGNVFGFFAGLAVLIACLGLFGLVSHTTLQRTKEIGVRKILGASVPHLLLLLSKDTLRLVVIANLLAWPLAVWGIQEWLQQYAFRTPLHPWLLVAPSVLVLLIAMLTVSFHTLRTARANPVDSLRSE